MKKNLKKIYILIICMLTNIIPVEVKATSITLNTSSLILGPNTSETIGYTTDNVLDNSNITWKSSNSNIIKVDQNGKVTAVAEEGYAIITATINENSYTCRVTISSDYVPISEITLNKSSLNILVGQTEKLVTTISPSNATNKIVTWVSSNPEIATISSSGKITAKKVGTTNILVTTNNGQQTECRVTVVDTIPLNKIILNKTNITIKEKSSETLNITFNPNNATNKKVTWKSSNANIVKVDANGKVTAINPGSATITVVSHDGGHAATCKVTVEEISKKVESIKLDKKELTITAGKTETLKPTINPDYAENKKVIWESSDEKIATVENGIITAIAPGNAEIKAISEDGNKEAICKINVISPSIKGISFSETEKTVYIESETKLNVINDPINSVLEEPIWKSSNEEVATIENGNLLAHSLGETTITVSTKEEKLTASIKIIVIEKPKEKLNITIEGYNLNFKPDIKSYNLNIGKETSLTINTNIEKDKVTINGNQNLKNGSIITITIVDQEKVTYIINVKKKQNYTIYFIAAISVLLLINLIRIIINNKKNKSKLT